MLEKKQALDSYSRATLLPPRSLEVFEKLGVLPAFVAQGQHNYAIRILRAPDRKLLLTFDFAPSGGRTNTPFALALSQDRTERILLDAVRAVDLVEVAFGEPPERYEIDGDQVVAHAAGGRAVKVSFLVGADGAHSTVRRQFGWELVGKTYPTRAFLADVRVDPAVDFESGWLADPKAPSFTIAVRFGGGVWRLIGSAIPQEIMEVEFPRARDASPLVCSGYRLRRALPLCAGRCRLRARHTSERRG